MIDSQILLPSTTKKRLVHRQPEVHRGPYYVQPSARGEGPTGPRGCGGERLVPARRLMVRPLQATCWSMCRKAALTKAGGRSAGAAAGGGQAAGAGPRQRTCCML